MPKISVVMPVYNGGEELRRALRGILDQTFRDFELIVVDDGSTDDTTSYLQSVRDPRLRIVHTDHGGITRALQCGLEQATGEYVARQDADDVSHPSRLALQSAFLDANPAIVLVGGQALMRNSIGRYCNVIAHPTTPDGLRWRLLFDNGFVHSLAMFRRGPALAAGGYRIEGAEDYDLWSRLSEEHELANLPEYLLIYRQAHTSLHSVNGQRIRDTALAISTAHIARLLEGTRWANQAANVARLQRLDVRPPCAEIPVAVEALLVLRHRFLHGCRPHNLGSSSGPPGASDRAYIDQYCWRLIAAAALLIASPSRAMTVLRLWWLSRRCGTSVWRLPILALLLLAATALRGEHHRRVRNLAGRLLSWQPGSLAAARRRIPAYPADSVFAAEISGKGNGRALWPAPQRTSRAFHRR